jgi:hypothetical protein
LSEDSHYQLVIAAADEKGPVKVLAELTLEKE